MNTLKTVSKKGVNILNLSAGINLLSDIGLYPPGYANKKIKSTLKGAIYSAGRFACETVSADFYPLTSYR
jgi:hypothetical protein